LEPEVTPGVAGVLVHLAGFELGQNLKLGASGRFLSDSGKFFACGFEGSSSTLQVAILRQSAASNVNVEVCSSMGY